MSLLCPGGMRGHRKQGNLQPPSPAAPRPLGCHCWPCWGCQELTNLDTFRQLLSSASCFVEQGGFCCRRESIIWQSQDDRKRLLVFDILKGNGKQPTSPFLPAKPTTSYYTLLGSFLLQIGSTTAGLLQCQWATSQKDAWPWLQTCCHRKWHLGCNGASGSLRAKIPHGRQNPAGWVGNKSLKVPTH